MNYYFLAFKKYAEFGGRAMRKEYWIFVLINAAIAVAIEMTELMTGMASGTGGGPIYWLFVLVTFIPGLAVLVRRLHDTNHSGWWFFINFVPIVGFIVLLVFLASDSQPGSNKYGPNPKELPKPAVS